MRRYFDIIRKSADVTPLKHLTKKVDPQQEGRFGKTFKKVYFIIWGLFLLVDLLFATADLLHFSPFSIFYSRPAIISNQDLAEKGKKGKVAGVQTPTFLPQPSPAPEISQEPVIDKSTISIRVLNGSGKSGQAALAKKTLEKKDFTVKSIGTAKKIYPATIIYYKDSLDKAKMVQEALAGKQSERQQSSITGEYDILVVVGRK